ncbi:hypothetical protein GCM10011415_29690 [Salipiger pallidus]|uniref:Uncharacterized protein n=1 Tax=Salipiger pallidus TaxID=1775170 RepID=A0A8J2ZLU7_9RHOB|nr:hypothetical protein [Salipiger pallidus]GGG78736.1 hypothetical protein GCM10011415_29690 [Salipiger pallidus]
MEIQVIKKGLKAKWDRAIVHEPVLDEPGFLRIRVLNDLVTFKTKVDLIVANGLTDDIRDVSDKVFTRVLFGGD